MNKIDGNMSKYLECETESIFTAEEVRQFFYCNRIPFFRHMHKASPPQTFLQQIGSELHEKQAQKDAKNPLKLLEALKNSEDYDKLKNLDAFKLKQQELHLLYKHLTDENPPLTKIFDIYLYNRDINLYGIADCILLRNHKLVPVEIKTGTPPKSHKSPYNPHKMQLTALALLIEREFDIVVDEAMLHYVSLNKTVNFDITIDAKMKVFTAVEEMGRMQKYEIVPNATRYPQMCYTCEYYPYCGGV